MKEKKKLDKKIWVPALIGIIAAYYANDFICALAPRHGHMWGFEDMTQRWNFTKLKFPFNFISPGVAILAFILTYKGVKAGLGKSKREDDEVF